MVNLEQMYTPFKLIHVSGRFLKRVGWFDFYSKVKMSASRFSCDLRLFPSLLYIKESCVIEQWWWSARKCVVSIQCTFTRIRPRIFYDIHFFFVVFPSSSVGISARFERFLSWYWTCVREMCPTEGLLVTARRENVIVAEPFPTKGFS